MRRSTERRRRRDLVINGVTRMGLFRRGNTGEIVQLLLDGKASPWSLRYA